MRGNDRSIKIVLSLLSYNIARTSPAKSEKGEEISAGRRGGVHLRRGETYFRVDLGKAKTSGDKSFFTAGKPDSRFYGAGRTQRMPDCAFEGNNGR